MYTGQNLVLTVDLKREEKNGKWGAWRCFWWIKDRMIVIWKEWYWYNELLKDNCWDHQNPNLLLSLDLSTYSWICCWSTGSSTTSLVLKETYLEGSKSAGLSWSLPLRALQASISEIWIRMDIYGGVLLVFRALNDSTEWRDDIDVDASVRAVWVLERHKIF